MRGMRIYGKNRLLGLFRAWLKRQMGGKARAGRSAGGDKRGLLGSKKGERPACHARHREKLNRKTCAEIVKCGSNLDKAVKARAGREKGDQRILGSGDFVANVMKDANEVLDQTAKFDISLDELISRVCAKYEIRVKDLVSKSRKRYLTPIT